MPTALSTVFEFDHLVEASPNADLPPGMHGIPASTHAWLEERCIGTTAKEGAPWLRLARRDRRRAVQVTGYVGVIQAPDGHQIEVLPKIGRALDGGAAESRRLLVEMLCCLPGFRHIQTEHALIAAARLPLFEVFIAEFLRAVEQVARRGLRRAYVERERDLHVLRGKLLIANHMRRNLLRPDRFFVRYDEFLVDRPDNRLIRTALRCVLTTTTSTEHQRLARELEFVFAEVPFSAQPELDIARVRLDRNMRHYADGVAWATLILRGQSPLTGSGSQNSPSLLFPMDRLFETFVAEHLRRQLAPEFRLRTQAGDQWLMRHRGEDWFRLRPDLVVQEGPTNVLVLDTKWKLLDDAKANRTDKYGLSESDFYQLRAYGEHFLEGVGDVVLVYPSTDTFDRPLPVFEFLGEGALRLWAVPFCLKERRLQVPRQAIFAAMFQAADRSNTPSFSV